MASFGTGATATTTIGKVLGLGEGVIGSASILFSADDMMVNRNGTAMERAFHRLHIEINMAKKATTYLSLTTGGVGVIKSFKTRSVTEGVLNSTGLISTGINCTFNEKK